MVSNHIKEWIKISYLCYSYNQLVNDYISENVETSIYIFSRSFKTCCLSKKILCYHKIGFKRRLQVYSSNIIVLVILKF